MAKVDALCDFLQVCFQPPTRPSSLGAQPSEKERPPAESFVKHQTSPVAPGGELLVASRNLYFRTGPHPSCIILSLKPTS